MNAFHRRQDAAGRSLASLSALSRQAAFTLALGAALCALPDSVMAETAVTIRSAELQAQSQSDSATLASLAANTRVEILRRSGAWSEVKTSAGQKGWVRMLALRIEGEGGSAPATSSSASGNGLSGLGNLLAPGRSSGNATVTTGVRGLTEEELRNAQANAAELQKMQKFAADRNAAQGFARRTSLTPVKLDYLPEPAPAAVSQPSRQGEY